MAYGALQAGRTGRLRLSPARLAAPLLQTLAAERERWLLWLPVFFGLGIAVYFQLTAEPGLILSGALLFAAAVLALFTRGRGGLFALALLVLATAAGFATAQLRTWSVAAPALSQEIGPTEVRGILVALEPHEAGWRVLMEPRRIGRLAEAELPARVRINFAVSLIPEPWRLAPGTSLSALAVLRPPPAPAAPGAFDFARVAYFERLGGVGYAVSRIEAGPDRLEAGGALGAWRRYWNGLRRDLSARIQAAVPRKEGAVAAALLTGERGAIPEEVIADMRDSGLAHLLAISGLHVGLVAGTLFFALRGLFSLFPRIALYHPIKKWAAVAALCIAFVYLFLVGATVPTQRAFLMIGVAFLAVLLDRTPFSLRLVALAAAVVLIVAPESLLGASFQMSFAAVTLMIAAFEILQKRKEGRDAGETSWLLPRGPLRRTALYLGLVTFSSVLAILATGGFAAFHFNRLTCYGLLANLAAVPATALWVMPWGLVSLLLMPLGLENWGLQPMSWGIALILEIAAWVAELPGAVVLLPSMPLWGLAAFVVGGLWLCIWSRRWRLLGLPLVVLGFLSVLLAPQRPDILISEDGSLIAVRDSQQGGLLLSQDRRERFSAELWLRRDGQSQAALFPESGAGPRGGLSCDALGCFYRARSGLSAAILRDNRGLAEDCAAADLVVSLAPIRSACLGPDGRRRPQIDRFDLWREGPHAVWLDPEGAVRIVSVQDRRGRRPWVRWRD
ncbi:MAG: ComEC/Rec2 family competence protein [Rhodovibrionaceae bacterium]